MESIVEILQSHMILTMSHWSSGLTCLLPATRVTGSNPQGGYLCETGSLLLAMSRYSIPLKSYQKTSLIIVLSVLGNFFQK